MGLNRESGRRVGHRHLVRNNPIPIVGWVGVSLVVERGNPLRGEVERQCVDGGLVGVLDPVGVETCAGLNGRNEDVGITGDVHVDGHRVHPAAVAGGDDADDERDCA
jgi:hypothetical protein